MTISKKSIICLLMCLLLLCQTGCRLRERKEDSYESSDIAEDSAWEEYAIPEEFTEESAMESMADETSDESEITTAMSGEFSKFSTLSDTLMEWGSGGPTDQDGRPNGATVYQQKYGQYDAYFLIPDSDKLYLSFDEGYEYGFTPVILDVLKEKQVTAVFFITMHFAASEPDLVQRIIDEGHLLGNHSTSHKSYPSLPMAEAAEDLMELHDYVKETFGYEMKLFRHPEGKFSEQTLAVIRDCGYKSMFWSFAYVDYYVDNQPLTIDALDHITSKAHPGALYLLHAVSRTNSEVLGEAIDLLRGNGYEFSDWKDFA